MSILCTERFYSTQSTDATLKPAGSDKPASEATEQSPSSATSANEKSAAEVSGQGTVTQTESESKVTASNENKSTVESSEHSSGIQTQSESKLTATEEKQESDGKDTASQDQSHIPFEQRIASDWPPSIRVPSYTLIGLFIFTLLYTFFAIRGTSLLLHSIEILFLKFP